MSDEVIRACKNCSSKQPFVPAEVHAESPAVAFGWHCPVCGFSSREMTDSSIACSSINNYIPVPNRDAMEKELASNLLRRTPRNLGIEPPREN